VFALFATPAAAICSFLSATAFLLAVAAICSFSTFFASPSASFSASFALFFATYLLQAHRRVWHLLDALFPFS
jgi:hypothetical protein